MTSLQIWCITSTVIWFYIAWAGSRRLMDPLNPVTIFALFFLMGYPFKLLLTTYEYSVIDSNQFGEGWQLYGLVLSNISGLLFCLPFLWAKTYVAPSRGVDERQTVIELRWIAAFFVLFLLAAGPEALPRLFSLGSLQEWSSIKNEFRVGKAFSSLATYGYTVCLVVHMWQVVRFERPGVAWRILLFIFWSVMSLALFGVTNSKYSALLPLAVFVLLKSQWMVRQGIPWSFRRVVGLGVGMMLLFTLVGYLRAFGNWSNLQDYTEFENTLRQVIYAFDMPDNLTAIVYRMDDLWFGDLNYEPTLQNVVYSLIPRFVWPEKPLIMSNLFIMQNYLSERFIDHLGEVVSPSMPGELMASGGMFFVVIGSLLLGLLYRVMFDWVNSARCSSLALSCYIWLTVNIFNLQRSGTGIVSTLVICSGVAVLVLLVLEGKSWSSRRTTRSAYRADPVFMKRSSNQGLS